MALSGDGIVVAVGNENHLLACRLLAGGRHLLMAAENARMAALSISAMYCRDLCITVLRGGAAGCAA